MMTQRFFAFLFAAALAPAALAQDYPSKPVRFVVGRLTRLRREAVGSRSRCRPRQPDRSTTSLLGQAGGEPLEMLHRPRRARQCDDTVRD